MSRFNKVSVKYIRSFFIQAAIIIKVEDSNDGVIKENLRVILELSILRRLFMPKDFFEPLREVSEIGRVLKDKVLFFYSEEIFFVIL